MLLVALVTNIYANLSLVPPIVTGKGGGMTVAYGVAGNILP